MARSFEELKAKIAAEPERWARVLAEIEAAAHAHECDDRASGTIIPNERFIEQVARWFRVPTHLVWTTTVRGRRAWQLNGRRRGYRR